MGISYDSHRVTKRYDIGSYIGHTNVISQGHITSHSHSMWWGSHIMGILWGLWEDVV